MKLTKSLLLSSIIALSIGNTVMVQADTNSSTTTATTTANTNNVLTPQQTQAVQNVVHSYLVQHPEVLVQSFQTLRQQQQQQAEQQALQATRTNAAALLRSANSPVAGNPKGTITMVEFFDYRCPHCRDMAPIVEQLIKQNPDLRVVFKEFPIFGQPSQYAAQMALAANKQGKYFAMHNALMSATDFSQSNLLSVAKSVGLNVTQLQKDMQSSAINNEISNAYQLAQALALIGTPAFIITDTNLTANSNDQIVFIPGETDAGTLQAGIDKVKNS